MQSKREGTNYPIEFMRITGVILITFTHIRHDFTEGAVYFVLETLPKYGTLLLSIISGYLFYNHKGKNKLLQKKVTSLLIPFLIANAAVLLPVLIINAMGYNYLNRLNYDINLFLNGFLAINDVPVNPPTYFIRDLFVIFCCLSLLQKDYRALFIIVPLLLFGKLLLRWDIAILFFIGFLINKLAVDKTSFAYKSLIGIPVVTASLLFYEEYEFYKYCIATLFFLLVININIKFVKTGAYTYLLHLYHSPIIVFIFPILHSLTPHPYLEAAIQVVFAVTVCYLIFLIVKKLNLKIVFGNR